jgi:hypothetical protein
MNKRTLVLPLKESNLQEAIKCNINDKIKSEELIFLPNETAQLAVKITMPTHMKNLPTSLLRLVIQ